MLMLPPVQACFVSLSLTPAGLLMLMLVFCRLLEAAKQARRHARTGRLPPCRSACSQALLLLSLQAFKLQTQVRLKSCSAAVLHVLQQVARWT